MTTKTIAFQGLSGAYSDLACRAAYPGWTTLPCPSFEAAMEALREGRCDLAMLPCENSLAGRVPDIHRMLPDSGLFVIGEHFQRVEHCLLAPKGATLATIRRAHSHPVALGQVLRLLRLAAGEQDRLGREQRREERNRREAAAEFLGEHAAFLGRQADAAVRLRHARGGEAEVDDLPPQRRVVGRVRLHDAPRRLRPRVRRQHTPGGLAERLGVVREIEVQDTLPQCLHEACAAEAARASRDL